jgi:hypothetical protein
MKTHTRITHSIMGVAAGAALLFATGCGNSEQPAGDTTKTTSPSASEAPQTAQPPMPAAAEAQKTVEAAEPATQEAQAAAAATAQQTASAASNQAVTAVAASMTEVQSLIEKAKGLVTDEKYKDALTVVQQLSGLRLTPEQRSLVDGLKAQIQTALAKSTAPDAASALGNVLGGKK